MQEITNVPMWDYYELELKGTDAGNPYLDIDLQATFCFANREITVPGFYDGKGIYRVRFMPDTEGQWRVFTVSNCAELDEVTATFICTQAKPDSHGPVAVANKYHFAHKDGTPFFPFGTTCYAWTHQPIALQNLTLETLAKTGFNKIRMSIFPKHYIYSENEPLSDIYENVDGQFDFDKPIYESFQHFEQQVSKLNELGIQADVILFHPYDRWGYCEMTHEQDVRYLKYVCARLAAFSNVWWALANEYDFLLDTKKIHHWDHFFEVIEENDPYHHVKSIHNGEPTMDFNHRKPWVDHVCIQNWDVKRTAEWRNSWGKPIVNDEPEYEGDIPRPWGNITAQELVHRFWTTVMRGGYASHGETYMNDTDTLWWAKGGVLIGESWQRIKFLRELIEADVKNGLTPLVPNDSWEFTRVSGAIDGDVTYLYFGEHQPKQWAVGLPKEDGEYQIDLIDTWNMTVTPISKAPLPVSPALRQRGGTITGGDPEAAFGVNLPGKPYMAVRVKKIK